MTDIQAAQSSRWLIREPHESEFPAIRALLPEVAADPTGHVFRLAVDLEKQAIRGALSYVDHAPSISNVRLHVVKSHRRQGVGSCLLNYAVDQARRLGRSRVLAEVDVREQPDAEAFLRAGGFHKIGQFTSVRGPLVGRGPNGALFRKSLAKAQDLPPDSRAVRIDDAPVDQIKALFLDHIGNVPLLADAHRTFQPERYKESIVVLSGDRVIGFVLAFADGNCVHVPALVVIPEYRGRGFSARLLQTFEDHLDPSIVEAQFDFSEAAPYTAKLAANFGHEVLRVVARFQHNLTNEVVR